MQRSTKVRVTASLVAISAVEKRTVWSFASGLPNAVRSLTYLMVSSSTFSAPAMEPTAIESRSRGRFCIR